MFEISESQLFWFHIRYLYRYRIFEKDFPPYDKKKELNIFGIDHFLAGKYYRPETIIGEKQATQQKVIRP